MSKARDLADGTFDTDTLVVDAANNRVGIGTTSPARDLHINGTSANSKAFARFTHDGLASTGLDVGYSSGDYASIYNAENTAMVFSTNTAERMRIDSSGNVIFNNTVVPSSSEGGAAFDPNTNGRAVLKLGTTSTGNQGLAEFFNPNGQVGGIVVNGSATSYNTSSDYRLKENVVDLTGASDRVNQIPVHRFNFIADPDKTVDGFLAHEVADIVPEAISGEKDAMRDEEYEVTPAVYEDVIIPAVLDDEGNEIEPERTEQRLVTEAVMGTRSVPDYQGIDQSKLVPLLTAALQHPLSEIADLKARVAALETP